MIFLKFRKLNIRHSYFKAVLVLVVAHRSHCRLSADSQASPPEPRYYPANLTSQGSSWWIAGESGKGCLSIYAQT